MTTLFLDISGGNVRVLLTEGYRLVDLRTLDISGTGTGLGEILDKIYSVTGQKVGQAHLILPEEAVHAEVCKLQKMSLADAEKVVQRQQIGKSSQQQPIVQVTEMAGPDHQLVCLAESVDRDMIERYQEVFTARRIKLATITSHLQSLLAAFSASREAVENVEIVFHIGAASITALFFSNHELLYHKHIVVENVELPHGDGDDPVRSLKRKQFSVLTPLHGIYSNFMRDHPEVQVDKIWLCGPFEGIEGIAESLTEATGLAVLLADHIADFEEGSCAFTALAGLLQAQGDPQRVNFIPADMLKPTAMRPRFLFWSAVAIISMCAVAVIGLTEYRLFSLKKETSAAQSELAALELSAQMTAKRKSDLNFLVDLQRSSIPFYEIFRELANTLPQEIMLKGLRYDNSSGEPVLHIDATTNYGPFNARGRVLGELVKALEQSNYLSDYTDPVIEVNNFGEEKMVLISLSCKIPGENGS